MLAEIIGVGAALAARGSVESSARIIGEELEVCGVEIYGFDAAGDSVQKLRSAIAKALRRSDIVILVGGLGMGADGISKETVCEGLGRQLVLHEDSLRRIKEAYVRAGRQMPQAATRLAMLPEQSIVFPGVKGITPGCALSAGDQFIIMLPERPDEFTPMLQKSVVPYLAEFSAAAVTTRTVNVFGLDEQQVESRLGKLMKSQNPTLAIYPKRGEVQIRLTARAGSKSEAAAILSPVGKEISKLLGSAVYGVDSPGLTQLVVGKLKERRMAVSVGDGCTSGMLGDMITSAQGQELVLRFGISAISNRVKCESLKVPEKTIRKFGAVSEQVAAAMAGGALAVGGSNSQLGIAIAGNTGAKGEDPKRNGLLFVALCDRESVWVRKVVVPKTAQPDFVRYMACMNALDLVRLYLAASPGKLAGGAPLRAALNGKINPMQTPDAPGGGRGGKRPWYGAFLPVKGDPAMEVVRKLILIIAILVFICSATYLVHNKLSSANNKKDYENIASQFGEVSEEEVKSLKKSGDYPEDYQAKFANLYKINQDVAGWVKIPDTNVNYPVVQTQDNDFYLRRDFNKKDNKHGVPWLDAGNSMNPQDDNYVVYAHNMADGQMFGELMKYKPSGEGLPYMQAHPIISFADVYRNNEYKIVSVFITNAKTQYGDIFYYNTYHDLSDKAVFDEYVSEITARSYYTSNIDIKPGDKFITLSTCSYEYGPVSDDAHVRTVIVGRRLRDGEKDDGSDVTYKLNPSPKMPQGFTNDRSNAAINAAAASSKAASDAAASAGASGTQQQEEEGPGIPGATTTHTSSAASNASSGASSQGASSSGTSSVDMNDLSEEEYDAWYYASAAQEAQQTAENAQSDARKAAREAERASTARNARSAAEDAKRAERRANDAYYAAMDAKDAASELYDANRGSSTIKSAYDAAVKAFNAAKKAWQSAEESAADAEDSAAGMEESSSSRNESSNNQSSSSNQSSNSDTSSTPKPETPSSSTPEPPPSSSSEPEPPPSSSSEPEPPPSSSSEPEPPPSSTSEPEPPPSSIPEPEKPPAEESAPPPENTNSAAENGEASTASARLAPSTERVQVLSSTVNRLSIVTGGQTLTGKARDIVARVVMNEMGNGFEEEAIKAQAVAVYTFVSYQNERGVTPYLGTREASDEVRQAVDEVIGEAVYYGDGLAFTPFHSTSAGVTISSADVWGGSYPYLVSVESGVDLNAPNYEMEASFDAAAVAQRVDKVFGIDLYDYSDDPADWFEIEEYVDDNIYVKSLRVGDESVSGRAFREQAMGLRSAAFSIRYHARTDKFTFTTYGYGHGVGMSQNGANLYAGEGWDHAEILEHYYPGTEVR